MKKPEKTKARAAGVAVPQSKEEAARFLRDIGVKQRMLTRIEAQMNDEIAKIKESAEYEAEPHRGALKNLVEGLRIWCDANRADLTEGGKRKHADLGTGTIEWRVQPPKVSIRGGVEKAIAAIRASGFAGLFLREKTEIDKEAMLREPESAASIPGVSIVREGEAFYPKPFETELQGAE